MTIHVFAISYAADILHLLDLMNDLQHISEADHGPVLVTLNPPKEPCPDTVVGRYTYEHPVLNAKVHMKEILTKRLISRDLLHRLGLLSVPL